MVLHSSHQLRPSQHSVVDHSKEKIQNAVVLCLNRITEYEEQKKRRFKYLSCERIKSGKIIAQEKAAATIQKHYRGYLVRKELLPKLEIYKSNNALAFIQSKLKCQLTDLDGLVALMKRKKMLQSIFADKYETHDLEKKIIIIQRFCKRLRKKKLLNLLYEERTNEEIEKKQDRAAKLIQKYWTIYSTRKKRIKLLEEVKSHYWEERLLEKRENHASLVISLCCQRFFAHQILLQAHRKKPCDFVACTAFPIIVLNSNEEPKRSESAIYFNNSILERHYREHHRLRNDEVSHKNMKMLSSVCAVFPKQAIDSCSPPLIERAIDTTMNYNEEYLPKKQSVEKQTMPKNTSSLYIVSELSSRFVEREENNNVRDCCVENTDTATKCTTMNKENVRVCWSIASPKNINASRQDTVGHNSAPEALLPFSERECVERDTPIKKEINGFLDSLEDEDASLSGVHYFNGNSFSYSTGKKKVEESTYRPRHTLPIDNHSLQGTHHYKQTPFRDKQNIDGRKKADEKLSKSPNDQVHNKIKEVEGGSSDIKKNVLRDSFKEQGRAKNKKNQVLIDRTFLVDNLKCSKGNKKKRAQLTLNKLQPNERVFLPYIQISPKPKLRLTLNTPIDENASIGFDSDPCIQLTTTDNYNAKEKYPSSRYSSQETTRHSRSRKTKKRNTLSEEAVKESAHIELCAIQDCIPKSIAKERHSSNHQEHCLRRNIAREGSVLADSLLKKKQGIITKCTDALESKSIVHESHLIQHCSPSPSSNRLNHSGASLQAKVIQQLSARRGESVPLRNFSSFDKTSPATSNSNYDINKAESESNLNNIAGKSATVNEKEDLKTKICNQSELGQEDVWFGSDSDASSEHQSYDRKSAHTLNSHCTADKSSSFVGRGNLHSLLSSYSNQAILNYYKR